jgi:large subunit ribosomal protein L4
MPNITIYNTQGKSVGEVELNADHFGVKPNPALIHEAVVAQQANARHAIAHTKTKGEVSGGGKKPWKQKGTGRARHGSTRSPIWVGGGITFGPRSNRNFSIKINRKARKQAMFMVLSDKLANQHMIATEVMTLSKTKAFVSFIASLPVSRKVLYVIASSRPELVRSARNLENVFVVTANALNVVDLLRYDFVVFEKDAITAFESLHCGSKKTS